FHNSILQQNPGADFWRNYIRTTVHEIGHTFNLPHSFESNQFAALGINEATFMNYPWKYGAGAFDRANEDAYWKAFQFRFSRGEQLQLAHGSIFGAVMGGRFTGQGTTDAGAVPLGSTPIVDGLRLVLELRPRPEVPLVEFGAPVHAEVRLVNVCGTS